MNKRIALSLAALVLVAPVLVAQGGCKRSTRPNASVDRTKYLQAFGECTHATVRSFQGAAGELAAATAKLDAEPSDATRAAARAAWEKAIDLWQQAEMMTIGPAAPTGVPGGRALRDPIYAWPLVNRCFIEQNLVAKGWEDPAFSTNALISVRGLAAVEYLSYYEATDNVCPSTATINATGTWAAITADDLGKRKRAYAKVAADDVSKQSTALLDAWDPAKGNFTAMLATAGKGSALYARQELALNAVTDALFYLDTETKDLKLAKPLGLPAGDGGVECTTGTCPERLESLWAKRSKAHLRNNLVGFRKLFTGCAADFSGVGFDDLLQELGAGELGKRMDADVVAAIAAVDAVPFATLDEALAKDSASVRRVYDAIKKITDALKTEFVGVLGLDLPKRVEGDND
ncbi:MAG: imelysin family protein [Deltaproteobacteria bacterium]|nr:imelysin family protein [Deltaproteobacteria bacterium]